MLYATCGSGHKQANNEECVMLAFRNWSGPSCLASEHEALKVTSEGVGQEVNIAIQRSLIPTLC